MHIPDGYLSPVTYGVLYAGMAPLWYRASKILKKKLKAREVPYLAMASAFTFVIMMFNIPLPGGTTGHAVGAALAAIILGPWSALMAVSVALIIQALLFGDGGITAIGANCFNMAFIMPFSGYYIYKLLSIGAGLLSWRRIAAAAIAGYVSLNLSALFTAVELGIQPLIAHKPDGTPLYAPYPLSFAVPVMAAGHLLLLGFVEAVITAFVFVYIAKTDPSLLDFGRARSPEGQSHPSPLGGEDKYAGSWLRKSTKKLWIGLAILVVLTPLGLIASGTAWGEWTKEELKKMLGFVPAGLENFSGKWNAILKGYGFSGWNTPFMQFLGYAFAALIGVAVVIIVYFILGKLLSSKKNRDNNDRS